MSKPYDATTKVLVEKYPLDWLRQLGIAQLGPAVAITADLSTVTTEADRVLLIKAKRPWILHIEFQSSADADLPDRMMRYSALLWTKYKRPVHSAVVLLRPETDHPTCTGHVGFQVAAPAGLDFRYQVVRIWELKPEQLLEGGLGTLPLAPLTDTSKKELPDIIARMDEHIRRGKLKPNEAGSLWVATYVLMGLRLHTSIARTLLKGVIGMKDSVTYQAIIAEGQRKGRQEGRQEGRLEGLEEGIEKGIEKGLEIGRQDEARRMLLSFGTSVFGKPSLHAIKLLNAIESIHRLEALGKRIPAVKSWDELLKNRG